MFSRDDNKVKVSNAQIATFIGADTKVEGTVITKTSIRIDGTIIGGVCADGTVVLSKSGQIKGNVIAENIIIAGVVDGNMQITDKTNIEPTGEVYGDITTGRILIDEQSIFQGKCNMNINRDGKKSQRIKPSKESVKPAVKEDKPAEEERAVKEEKAVKDDKTVKDDKAVKEDKVVKEDKTAKEGKTVKEDKTV